jgi:hypothetical protein
VTTAERAKELLDLAATPTALVTGTFLAHATKAVRENKQEVQRSRMVFASLATFGACSLMLALVVVLAPLAYRSIFVFRGRIETILLVYWVLFLSAIGTLGYALFVASRCIKELRRPSD